MLFSASGPASAVAAPSAGTTKATSPCGKTGTHGTTSCAYTSAGPDTFTVPAGVTVATFKLDGAQGGSYPGTAPGGLGGSVTATLSVTPGQVFQVNVGGHGSADPTDGGVNSGSGGGGSSDVRTGRFRDADRVLAAGGGGGSGGSRSTSSELGGAGGQGGGGSGRSGDGGSTVAKGGAGATRRTGGAGGSGPGARGASGGKRKGGAGGSDGSRVGGPGGSGGGASGGVGVPSTTCPGGGGGGGGGYFGGGGGGAGNCTSGGGGGGGGGSNYAEPSARAVTFGVGVRSGNGRVSVSWPAGTVTFIGDSVTAGFGYCGASENAANISCRPNQEFADAWYIGDNSLHDCKPPAVPNDACSNDNYNGKPWLVPPWSPGPRSPRVAYPYQLAASQSDRSYAAVSDWAMTGATPADWDPDGGHFGPELRKIDDQYVVMTLGANPILSDFTYITLAGFDVAYGPCVSSTAYYRDGDWYAGPISAPVACVDKQWNKIGQTQHLMSVYEQLLRQNDHVLVLGYYRACSWSFGNWQPAGNLYTGPSAGHSCSSQSRFVSPTNHTRVSQWDQAVAVGDSVNSRIHDAVLAAQAWAKREWPGTDRYRDIAWTTPNETEWAEHQPLSPHGSWIFLNDTWIHPDKDGAAQLASTVADGMCSSFGRWCGAKRVWG